MRKQDWVTIFADELREAETKDFAWGKHDCCLAVADWVLAMTGEDFAKDLRGKYADEVGAAITLEKFTGEAELEPCIIKLLGQPLESVNFAQRGDVVIFQSKDGRDALGMIDLSGTRIVAVTTKGLIRLPINLARVAWRV